MRMLLSQPAVAAAFALVVAGPVMAQVPPPVAPYGQPYGPYQGGVPAAIADQHRYETERLRALSQAGADLAARQQAETQLRLRALEAARASAPSPLTAQPVPPRPFYTAEQERVLREAAIARGRTTTQGLGQIDAWLDHRD